MAESREGYALMQHWHDEANKLLSQALDLDQKGGEDKEAMIEFYSKGIANLKKAVEVRVDKSSKESEKLEKLRAKLSKNLELAQGRVKDLSAGKKPAGNQKGSSTSSQKQSKQPNGEDVPDCSPQEKMKVQVKGVDQRLVDIITNEIRVEDTNISFEDIVGLESAKEALLESAIYPALNPEVFAKSRAKGILLFGPPGNGKTMLAKAIAHEFRQAETSSTFLPVSASTLTSKYVGEGEKLVKALFAVARELQPTIIFIDEVDSILTQRGSGEHDAMRKLKTEFLLQYDGMGSSDSDRLLVVAATNRPQDIDDAALRRFEARILIPLPDSKARKSVLVKELQKEPKEGLSDEDIDRIISATEGYSNSDMTALVNDAARILRRELTQGLARESIKNLKLSQVRPILLKDFESALLERKPSVGPETLRDLEEWDKKN